MEGDRHQPVHREAALRGVRQFWRRPRDAGVDAGGRWPKADDAGTARRCETRVRLRPCWGAAGHQGRHVLSSVDGRGEEELLGCHQHEVRLETHLRVRAIKEKNHLASEYYLR